MNGTVYSPSRNDFQKVEISLQANQIKPMQRREEVDEEEEQDHKEDEIMKEKIRRPSMVIPQPIPRG